MLLNSAELKSKLILIAMSALLMTNMVDAADIRNAHFNTLLEMGYTYAQAIRVPKDYSLEDALDFLRPSLPCSSIEESLSSLVLEEEKPLASEVTINKVTINFLSYWGESEVYIINVPSGSTVFDAKEQLLLQLNQQRKIKYGNCSPEMHQLHDCSCRKSFPRYVADLRLYTQLRNEPLKKNLAFDTLSDEEISRLFVIEARPVRSVYVHILGIAQHKELKIPDENISVEEFYNYVEERLCKKFPDRFPPKSKIAILLGSRELRSIPNITKIADAPLSKDEIKIVRKPK